MKEPKQEQKQVYEPPAIIYEGELTTRAGSCIHGHGPDCWDVDPAQLFGSAS